ncbi:MAG: 4Fe-4S binding protein [Oscillospiraceae bacterium]|nr:4Fe-4S binding protein [Oscillospiraceae bacterium]
MKEKLKKLIPTKRKIMQLYFALLFNANLKGFVSGNIYQGSTKQFCAPGINCYSCPGAVGACPLGSFQGAFSADRSTLFYVGGILLLYSILFGRMICGWLCPFGLVQELLHKIPTPKVKKSPVTRVLSYLKYVILVFFVLIVPIMYAFRNTPLPAFCKYICPAGTLEGGIGLLSNAVNESYFSMLGPLFTWKFMLMVSILVGSVFIFRLFCRFICPLGALYGLFNKLSVFGVKVEKSKCTNCGLCHNHCKVDIKEVGDQECIGCGECIDVCPTNAISWKGIKASPDKDNGKHKKAKLVTRVISAVLLIGILAGAIAYYWQQPEHTNIVPGDQVDRGNQVGDLCYGQSLQVITPDGILEETLDPTAGGKVTVINFWGTWCTPCCAELPCFEQVAGEYGDSVSVFAVHSYLLAEDTAAAYIGANYADSPLTFLADYAIDDVGTSGYYTTLGGRGTYPYTVVLDESGVITKIFVSSVTYDMLKAAVEDALNN